MIISYNLDTEQLRQNQWLIVLSATTDMIASGPEPRLSGGMILKRLTCSAAVRQSCITCAAAFGRFHRGEAAQDECRRLSPEPHAPQPMDEDELRLLKTEKAALVDPSDPSQPIET